MNDAYGAFAKGNDDRNAQLLTVLQSVADGQVSTIVHEPFRIVTLQQSIESSFIPTGLFGTSFLRVLGENVGHQQMCVGQERTLGGKIDT